MIVADRAPPEDAMRKRRADTNEDDGPRLISLQDKHAADRLLHEAFAAGAMDEAEFKRRRGKVYSAVTPRELWKASGHRAGSRERADKADIWRSVRLQIAIVAFAAVIMVFVLLGTILSSQGGTKGTPVFPWEWGRDEPTTSEQR
jgi:anti-sigma-K factor RskA